MVLYSFARRLNARRKSYLKYRAGLSLSPVRRIERVAPVPGKRLVAMSFDDGPCALDFDGSGVALTQSLVGSLRQYGATASFDIIGSTGENYPDRKGVPGSFQFGGVAYDHYPCFDQDVLGGAVNQPELIRAILDGGNELTNHSYSHRLFGPKHVVYSSRKNLRSLDEVTEDLLRLHRYIRDTFGYEMKLARPPHYVDKILGGSSAYDAYRLLGYQYMAASYDGGGWQPQDSYEQEVESMVAPLNALLEQDPEALNGQIIFQKDGCNMALRAPIKDALPKQLKLLREYGYQVMSVSELLEHSCFEDLAPDDPSFPWAKRLANAGHITAYKNNTFHGERIITLEEFLLMSLNPERFHSNPRFQKRDLLRQAKADLGVDLKDASGNNLLNLALAKGIPVNESAFKDKPSVTRADAAELLAGMVKL